jgi:hypothetical protein
MIFAAGCSDGVDTGALNNNPSDAAVDGSTEALDATAAGDAPAADRADAGALSLDAPADVPPVGAADAPAVDAPARPDVSPPDVSPPDVGAADVGTADRPITDAGTPDTGAGCTGAAPTVTVTAPAQDEVIETCSASEAAVYYDFTASVAPGSSVQQVSARWITPDGAAAPPPATLSAAPFTFRRQVGGPMTGAPPLAVFGIRGGWRFEVTATDRCGRSTTASRSFSLVFTSRRCPNP